MLESQAGFQTEDVAMKVRSRTTVGFGEKPATLRGARGLSQEELAEAARVSAAW